MNATGGAASTTAAEATTAGGTAATDAAGQRPMRADARRNYDRLLAETAAAFAERGSDDVSLEEIARRAQVGIGTLYRHFPTRHALLEAVYRDQIETLAAEARQHFDHADNPGTKRPAHHTYKGLVRLRQLHNLLRHRVCVLRLTPRTGNQ